MSLLSKRYDVKSALEEEEEEEGAG